MDKELIELSIVIVNWNSWEYIDKCLSSIRKHAADISLEIIVIDNNSSDNSVENIRKYYPYVKLIAERDNHGFPKANNIGFDIAKGKYILALNPDTEIKSFTLQKSIEFLDKNISYSCVGVKTLKENGKIQYHCARKFFTLKGALSSYLLLDKMLPYIKFFDSPDMAYWDHKSSREVDMISGAYMMFRKSMYKKIGGFDTTIPMFYEDNEYCLRIWLSGYKIYYLAGYFVVRYI